MKHKEKDKNSVSAVYKHIVWNNHLSNVVYKRYAENVEFGTFWFKDEPVSREEYYKKNDYVTRKTVFQETNGITDGILPPDSKYIFRQSVLETLLGGLTNSKCAHCFEEFFGEGHSLQHILEPLTSETIEGWLLGE